MTGHNEIRLCPAEMMVALQEWLDKRMPDNDSDVSGIKESDGVFIIALNDGKE